MDNADHQSISQHRNRMSWVRHVWDFVLERNPTHTSDVAAQVDGIVRSALRAMKAASDQYEHNLRQLTVKVEQSVTDGYREVKTSLDPLLEKLHTRGRELQSRIEDWLRDGRRGPRIQETANEHLAKLSAWIEQHESHDLATIDSLAEEANQRLREIHDDPDGIRSQLSAEIISLITAMDQSLVQIKEISALVGSEYLVNAYTEEAQKHKVRLAEMLTIGSLILLAVVGFFQVKGFWQSVDELDVSATGSEVISGEWIRNTLARLAIVTPFVWLVSFCSKRCQRVVYLRSVYDHKRNTALTFQTILNRVVQWGDKDREGDEWKMLESLRHQLESALSEAVRNDPSVVFGTSKQ